MDRVTALGVEAYPLGVADACGVGVEVYVLRVHTTSTSGHTFAVRPIPLPDWCVTMLDHRHAALGRPVVGPIFPSSTGTVREASNVRNRVWNPFKERARFEWVTFRSFRKTVATLLDEAGLTARKIADILGHARPSLPQDVYMGRQAVSRDGADALHAVLGTDPSRT